jgi:DNA-binding response OmpR family regulator
VDEILLIAADWQFRALLRAQLLEEGFEVRSWPSLDYALAYLVRGGEPPQAIVLDAESVEVESRKVSDLWRSAGRVPLLLCAGASSRVELDRQELPPATVLTRPFRIRDIVRAVQRAASHARLE